MKLHAVRYTDIECGSDQYLRGKLGLVQPQQQKLLHWSQLRHRWTQCSVYQRPSPHPIRVPGCIVYWDAERYRKQDILQKLRQRDKAPHKNTNNSANTLTTGTRRLSSYPFHSTGVPSSTTREYPFPSGQPRGKEAGSVAVFGALLSMCVSICTLVINGGSSNICSFSCCHMTHSQSFLAPTRHKFWPPSFLATCLMWLRNGFRHFNTGKNRLLYS